MPEDGIFMGIDYRFFDNNDIDERMADIDLDIKAAVDDKSGALHEIVWDDGLDDAEKEAAEIELSLRMEEADYFLLHLG